MPILAGPGLDSLQFRGLRFPAEISGLPRIAFQISYFLVAGESRESSSASNGLSNLNIPRRASCKPKNHLRMAACETYLYANALPVLVFTALTLLLGF